MERIDIGSTSEIEVCGLKFIQNPNNMECYEGPGMDLWRSEDGWGVTVEGEDVTFPGYDDPKDAVEEALRALE